MADGTRPFSLADLTRLLGIADLEAEFSTALARLFPICRSITGDGVRQSLAILRESLALELHEVPSGTAALDWVVPKEWNVRDAYVKNARGERVIDFQRSSLHVMGYSVPVSRRMTLAELKPKLHSLPARPSWIPFRSSFYREDWGFCLEHERLEALPEGEYEVVVDSSLEDGSLTYGELLVPGSTPDEVLLSAHICHPSLCNDNLTGICVATLFARYLAARASAGRPARYSYRFLFAPVTIGAITWLSRNEHNLERIKHGLVLTLLGDPGQTHYKRSRHGAAAIDRAAEHVLAHSGQPYVVDEFSPYGYDERQFCSPGFDLPVGSLMRTPYQQFPEYHTSADNLSFVRPDKLVDSLAKCLAIFDVLEHDARYLNLSPKAEPQLGRRGIYRALSERQGDGSRELALLWVLNQSDGRHSLLDIAERSKLPFETIHDAARLLLDAGGLLAPLENGHDASA
jgi:aminopeptidase-like protein